MYLLRVRSAVFLAVMLAAASAGAQPFKGTKQPDVRYVPSPDSVVEAMLELARVNAGDVVYDMGSGDGRIPIAAAKRYGAAGVGVEIDAKLNRVAADQAKAAGVSDRFVSFVAIDWSGAKGKRHKGIAIAEARGSSAPRLVRPGHVWSREEVLGWLLERAATARNDSSWHELAEASSSCSGLASMALPPNATSPLITSSTPAAAPRT